MKLPFALPFEQLKIVIAIAAVVGALATAVSLGWVVRGWKEGAVTNANLQLIQQFKDEFHAHEQSVAGLLSEKLSTLKGNKTIVEKHFAQIVDRPVYRNVCLDDDGLRILEAARLGAAPASPAASAVP